MVENIGGQVGLIYEEESLDQITRLSGGHPFLARQLCSLIYKLRDRKPGQIVADDLTPAVHQFIYDDETVTRLDAGIWQEAGNKALWGAEAAMINQEIILEIASASKPVSIKELLSTSDAVLRQAAL